VLEFKVNNVSEGIFPKIQGNEQKTCLILRWIHSSDFMYLFLIIKGC